MGQTYNITMRHFNGVDYDTLLPASVQLEKIKYTGTGLFGESSPTSVMFSSAPQLVLLPNYGIPNKDGTLWRLQTNQSFTPAELFSTNYVQIASYASSSDGVLYAKKSNDGKTFSWYANKGAEQQSNTSGKEYYCYGISGLMSAIGAGSTTWLFTENQTFIVPFTGRYYLELHGGGGGAKYGYDVSRRKFSAGGGGSGQKYDSISLTAGESVNIVIGSAGENKPQQSGSGTPAVAGGLTSFGTYSVNGGGEAKFSASSINVAYLVAGAGSGNIGTSGSKILDSENSVAQGGVGGGIVGSFYGCGGAQAASTVEGQKNPTAGAVYLKYLGE